MKKSFLITVFLGLILLLSGCSQGAIKLSNYIVEKRNNFFTASTSKYQASFYTGLREEPYALDGVVGELTPFGIVVFGAFDDSVLTKNEYDFTIKINEETVSGKLEKNETDSNFYMDIERTVEDNAVVVLTVAIPNESFNETLVNASGSFQVKQEQALKIAAEELSDTIMQITKKDKTAEVIIKILQDNSFDGEQRYYWYVAIIGKDGKTAGILIDTNSAQIISKKV